MNKPKIQLCEIIFYFLVDEKEVMVKWLYLGRSEIKGRMYTSTYKVFINIGEGHDWTVSLQCNLSNSKLLLNQALKESKT